MGYREHTSVEDFLAYHREKDQKRLARLKPKRNRKKPKVKIISIKETKEIIKEVEKIKYVSIKTKREKDLNLGKALRYNDKKALRDKIYTQAGNKCSICGYNKNTNALVFHHVEPKDKLYTIAQLIKFGREDLIIEEIKKCILICWNCHIEIHQPNK